MKLWEFLNSSFIQSLVMACAPFLIGRFNIKPFFDQERIRRLQKFYYEDSLVAVLNNFDDAMENVKKNHTRFVSAVDVFQIYFEAGNASDFINEVLKAMENTLPYAGFKVKIFIEIFPNGHDVFQWARRTQKSFAMFNNLVTERLKETHHFVREYERSKKGNEEEIRSTLNKFAREIDLNFYLLQKNEALFYLFRKIVNRISLFEFRSREEIVESMKTDDELNRINDMFSECYKQLFGYYEIEPQKVYCTYAKISDGKRYKVFLQENQPAIVRPEVMGKLPDDQFFILIDETPVVDALIEGTDLSLAQELMSMINKKVFEDEYKLLPAREKLS